MLEADIRSTSLSSDMSSRFSVISSPMCIDSFSYFNMKHVILLLCSNP